MDRLKNLMLYIAKESQGDSLFGATKLNKLLFFIDFEAYALQGKPVTEATYIKMKFGPIPREVSEVERELVNASRATIERRLTMGGTQKRLKPLEEPDMSAFSEEEIALVDAMIKKYEGYGAQDLSRITHTYRPWLSTNEGDIIPFEAVYVMYDVPGTLQSEMWAYNRAKELEALRQWGGGGKALEG
jgi:uncharacterized phage-associated protein